MRVGNMSSQQSLPCSQILVLLSPCLMRRSACAYTHTFYFTAALPAHLRRSLNNLHTFPCCKHIARCPACAFNVLHTIKCCPLVPALCVRLRIDRRLNISGSGARSSAQPRLMNCAVRGQGKGCLVCSAEQKSSSPLPNFLPLICTGASRYCRPVCNNHEGVTKSVKRINQSEYSPGECEKDGTQNTYPSVYIRIC